MSATARVPSRTTTAITTGQNRPAEYPALAALPIHSSVANAPIPRMTRLASHGVSVPRAQLATVRGSPGEDPAGEDTDAAPGSFSLASCAWQDRATAAIAATTPASVAGDQCPDPPNPKNRTTVPNAPVLWYSRAMSSGTAIMSTARAAVMDADQPTQRARLAPRPGPPGPSVAHQRRNSARVTAAAMAGAAHHVHDVTRADAPPLWDQVSTPWARSSQPHPWPNTNNGTMARTKVTPAPSSSDSTPMSTVL